MLRLCIGATVFFFFSLQAHAANFFVKPDSCVILVWQQKAASWIVVKDSAAIGPTDSLYLEDQNYSRLLLGKGCTVLLKGELRATIAGSDTALMIRLDQGQVLLKRDEKPELAGIKIVLRGCTITPIGTAAAIKFTKQGEPTVAVLAGRVLMESPKGEAVVVAPGAYATYDPIAGSFKQGTLPMGAVASLENWSGVKLEQAQTGAAPGLTEAQKAPARDTAQKTPQQSRLGGQPASGAAQAPAPVPSQVAKADTSQKSQSAPQARKEEPKKEEPKKEGAK